MGDVTTVGFIGLGAMGSRMAPHLLEAGLHLVVWARRRVAADALVARGATFVNDAAAVVAASDVTITCVSNDAAISDVIEDVLSVVRGKVVVDCSTIDPALAIALAERVHAAGGAFLEAPVSGGTNGAAAGTLTVMVAGDAATLERARPALAPWAGSIVHVGGPGTGQTVKLCNQVVMAAQMLAVSEASVMAARAGVDLKLMVEVLQQSTGDCMAVRMRVPFEGVSPDGPASNDWAPGFAVDLLKKDLDLAIRQATRGDTPMYTAGIVRQMLVAASNEGYGDLDYSSLGRVLREQSGL